MTTSTGARDAFARAQSKGNTMNSNIDTLADSYVLARQLVNGAHEHGGGTITLDGVLPIGFYLVGGERPGLVETFGLGGRDTLTLRVQAWIDALPSDFHGALGVWVDGGLVYFDAVTLVDEFDDAAAIAGARDELAFGFISGGRDYFEYRRNDAGEYLLVD